MPYDSLARILRKLSRAGLLTSKEGRRGGYALARHPSAINVTDVLRAMNKPPKLVECTDVSNCRCPRYAVCAIVESMRTLHRQITAQLDAVTIADLAQSRAPASSSPRHQGSTRRR